MKTHPSSILLVEDDIVDRKAFVRAMKALKITSPVVVAEDGVEALEILRGRDPKRRLQRPFIIVLDLNMPRMNGFQFLEQLRGDPELSNAAVLVLTTSKARGDIERAYSHHVAGYLLKEDLGASFTEAIGALDRYWSLVQLPPE